MTQTKAARLLRKSQKWVHCRTVKSSKKFILMTLVKEKPLLGGTGCRH